jgi:hypothetical protein
MKRKVNRNKHDKGQARRGHGISMKVDGTVYPADWDEAGHVTALDLVTNDNQVLRIRNSEKLMAYQDTTIAAEGIVEQQHRAGRYILIKRFSVTQPSPEFSDAHSEL